MAEQAHGDHGHHELTYWRKYIFSVDHKIIGIQYAVTALFFLFFGFCLMMMMRWQLAYPGQPIPWIGKLFSAVNMPEGVMVPEFYNQLGAMHGTIMVFLGVVPLAVGGFGNYVLPLQIGAPDMAFPKINMASYWIFVVGGIIMLASFFVPEGAAQSGWTSYPPLANIAPTGQTWWLWGMVALITSSLLGSVNFIVTTVQMRAEGLSFFRLPFFVWAQFVTAFLLLLAFPAAGGRRRYAAHGSDRGYQLLHAERPGRNRAGAGSERRRQSAAVAAPVLVSCASGSLRSDSAGDGHRRRDCGQQYPPAAMGVSHAGLLDYLCRVHVVYRLGAPYVHDGDGDHNQYLLPGHDHDHLHSVGDYPDGVCVEPVRRVNPVSVPMLFCLAFIPMFAIGGLTGLPLGLTAADLHLHDTYYVIGHFHYVVAPGTIFALFAGSITGFPR